MWNTFPFLFMSPWAFYLLCSPMYPSGHSIQQKFIKLSTLGQAVGKVTQFFEPHIKHWLGELHQT